MKVSVKDFAITMEVKNKGIELDVYDNAGEHLGDLVITKTKLIWCKGRTTPKKGITVTWQQFINRMVTKKPKMPSPSRKRKARARV